MSTNSKTVYISISNVIQVLITLLLNIGLARAVKSKNDYGMFQQIFVGINFLISVFAAFPNSFLYFFGFYSHDSERKDVTKRFFMSLLILSLVVGVGGFFLRSQFNNVLFSQNIIIVVIITILRLIFSYFLNFYLVTDKLRYFIKINVVILLLTAILVFLSFKYSLSIGNILLFVLLIDVIRFLLMYPSINKFLWRNGNYVINKKETTYLLTTMGTTLIIALNLNTDRFIISSLLNVSSFIDYQVGAFIFPFVSIITVSVVTVLFPKVVTNYQQRKYDLVVQDMKNAQEKLTVILLPVFVYFFLFGKELITFLYSEKFEEAGIISQVYTLRFLGIVVLSGMIMSAIELEKWLLISSILNLLLGIIFNLIFIKYFGIMGAVYSAIIGSYIGYILPVFLVNKQLKTKFLTHFPLLCYLKTLLVSFLFAGVFKYLFMTFGLHKTWAVVFSVIYYGITFMIINIFVHQVIDIQKIIKNCFTHLLPHRYKEDRGDS